MSLMWTKFNEYERKECGAIDCGINIWETTFNL